MYKSYNQEFKIDSLILVLYFAKSGCGEEWCNKFYTIDNCFSRTWLFALLYQGTQNGYPQRTFMLAKHKVRTVDRKDLY